MISTRGAWASFWRLAVAVLTILVVAVVPVSAQQDEASGDVSLVQQSEWVSGGNPFELVVRVDTDLAPDQAELAVTVHGALPNRSQFQRTLGGNGLGSVVLLERQQLEGAVGPDGTVRISLPVQDPEQRRYFLRSTGVFPVKVELRSLGTTQALDSFTTHLVNLAPNGTVSTKLGVATALNVASPRANVGDDALGLPDDGASIGVATSILQSNPDLPMAVLPSPESLERVETSENGTQLLANLRAAVGNRQVLGTSWVPAGAPLFSDELSDEGRAQLDRGDEVVTRVLGEPAPTIASRATTDPATVRALRNAGAQRVLVPDDSLASRSGLTTLRPFDLESGEGPDDTVRALQIDTGLYRHFVDSEGPVLGAHRLLAELAVLWNDTPVLDRAVVVTGPPDWSPDPVFMGIFLRGISASPFVAPISFDSAFALPDATGDTKRVSASNVSEDYPTDEIADQRNRVDAISSLFGPESPTRDRINRRMLLAESALLDSDQRVAALSALSGAIDQTARSVRLPEERAIRLTASEGELPVSVQNDTGEEIRVVVRLSSDRASFPNGATRTLDAERAQLTDRFPIEAKTSGVFPVQMRLETPEGAMVLARSQILVSSTATTGVGLALTVGAGAFLVLWWIRSTLKSRRKAQ